MNAIFKKLNFKDQPHMLVLSAPDSFQPQLDDMGAHTAVHTSVSEAPPLAFALCFVTTQAEVDARAVALAEKMPGDILLWFAYPKGSSKRYRCDFNRDTGWAVLGQLGFEPVRMVAIDEDWSALRFRRTTFIKNLTRDPKMLLSKEGKARTNKEA